MVALVTPFRNSLIDYNDLKKLIDYQIESGTDGIIVCGSTGEGLFLTTEEREEIIKKSLEFADKRVPIIAGCSSHSTTEATALTKQAELLGSDGVLVIVPYYVKPTQEGIINHFEFIRENSNIPIILYNNPGRCAVNASIETIVELYEKKIIVAIKDSDPNITRATFIKKKAPGLTLLSGDDATYAGYLASGGDGCISVTANIEPRLLKNMLNAWQARDTETFKRINEKLAPLTDVLFVESNPIPVKYILSQKGLIENELRAPLTKASDKAALKINEVLAGF